jgi:hypothetical protein
VFAQNAGSPTSYYPNQIAAAWAGGGLTDTQANLVQYRINGCMRALGINVYNFLLKRDLDPAANDNSPMFLNQAA